MSIEKVNETTKQKIKQKSAFGLPDRPRDAKMSATDVKKAFYAPLVDATNSLICEIDRVVDETNTDISSVSASLATNVEELTTEIESKVNISDVINNLTSTDTSKPLSAKQGNALKSLIDSITIPTVIQTPNSSTTNILSSKGVEDNFVKKASANTISGTNTITGNIVANSKTISPTELGYLDGVSSNIQTQLNGKASISSGTGYAQIGNLQLCWGKATGVKPAGTTVYLPCYFTPSKSALVATSNNDLSYVAIMFNSTSSTSTITIKSSASAGAPVSYFVIGYN